MPGYKKVSKSVKRQPTTPVKGKAPVRRRRLSDVSSSLDLSDEEGYSDLDDITSDEDDEEDVEAAEEDHIIRSSPQPTEEEEEGDDEAGDAEDEEEEDDDDDDDEDDEDNDAVESASWDGILSDVEVDELNQDETDTLSMGNDSAVERRVRFDVPDSSDGDSTETDEDVVNRDFFPDIFVPQSSLDPGFRREIERDQDDDNNSDSGFWDFHSHDFTNHNNDSTFDDNVSTDIEAVLRSLQDDDDSTPIATPMNRQGSSTAQSSRRPSPEMDDDTSLDGYQTDGDTTEEEDDAKPVRPKTARELAEEDTDSEVVTIIRARRGQPRVGRFTLDNPRKKPIAIVNPKTGKMMIFTPQGGRNGGLDLSPEQFNFQWFEAEPQSSPMVNSGNMMMSAMVSSNTFGDFMNTQAIGPEEAFFSLPPDANYLDDMDFFEESGGEHEQEDEEKHLQLEDFIDFDDEFEGLSGDEAPANDEDPILCTPSSAGRPTTASGEMTSLLDHFETNADLVGAFRRDQANHQLISRSKATRESLAFSGPYYEGTLRGIKDGRIASTNVPISPLRKQRRTSELASSPLNTVNQKRKASGQQDWSHKRQRSMPDVNVLSL